MKSFVKALLLLISIQSSGIINAQKVWTLEQCIGYALQNNLQIKRQALQVDMANNNLTQSKIDFLPDLSASGTHNYGSGRAPNYSTFSYASNTLNSGNIGLQSNVIIFSGFQKIYTVKMRFYNFLSTRENLEKAKNDISLAIASAYLQILFNRELLDVTQSQLEVTKMQVDKTSKLVEVGNLARGSLLEIQAQAASEEANLTDAQNKLNLSYITLAQILDLDTLKNFEIYIPQEINVPETFSDNTDSVYKIALNNMPEIKGAEYSLLSAKSQLAVVRGSRFPQLTLTGYYDTQYDFNDSLSKPVIGSNGLPVIGPYGNIETVNYKKNPIGDQLKNNVYKQVSLNLSIPIFTKWQIQTRVSNAKINVLDAEFALKQNQIGLRKDIEQAYADALAAFQNHKSRQRSVAAYEENFKYVQQKFDVGLINSVDYNVAKNDYTKSKSDFLQAKYEFIFKTKILDFYKGNVIKL